MAAAREVTLDELKSFSKALLAEVDPVMLAHGNLTHAYALNLAQQVRAVVLDDSAIATVDRSRVRQLPAQETQVTPTLNIRTPATPFTLKATIPALRSARVSGCWRKSSAARSTKNCAPTGSLGTSSTLRLSRYWKPRLLVL